jgi:hypothetical protein
MSEEYHGPSPETLRQLREQMPSVARGIANKAIGGRARVKAPAKEPPLQPTKVCEVCSVLFDMKRGFEGDIESGVCVECQRELDKGLTAFVATDRWAFGTSPLLEDMVGKIVHVSNRTMDELEKRFESQKKESNGNAKENPA